MSISEPDRQVLKLLAEDGDNHCIPRPVMHYFYGDREPLEHIANELEVLGWTDLELARGPEEHRLIATLSTDLNDSSIVAMMAAIEMAIAGVSVTYDGWETSVERSN